MDIHPDTSEFPVQRLPGACRKSRGSQPHKAKNPLLTRAELDGRTNAARHFDRLIADIEADLGGHDQLSTIERSLIEGFAGAAVVLDNLNTRLALGERINLGEHAQCVNALTKIASRLGLRRRARTVRRLGDLWAADLQRGKQP